MEDKFSFEDLKVFQEAILFIKKVYQITNTFPKEETYNLTSQFKRAAVSISLNIGEGSGGTKNEFINFLRIARKSINECVVCVIIAKQQKYIGDEIEKELRVQLTSLSKMIAGLISSIEKRNTQPAAI
jgi:four helix bundle protein